MIYIKEENGYVKYFAGVDGKLIRTGPNGDESVILNDVSGEFDAICADDGNTHFVLQSTSGELVYLKKTSLIWTKYKIFKNRDNTRKISGLVLKKSGDFLCAFYTIEHGGNHMMIRHRLADKKLFEEPVVLGMTDARRDFCVCRNNDGEFVLFFRNLDGDREKLVLDRNFMLKKREKTNLDKNILSMRCLCANNEFYAVCTRNNKGNIALEFFGDADAGHKKIITFGISAACVPQIIVFEKTIIIQWEENGSIVQVESSDSGKSFCKPKTLGKGCVWVKLRVPAPEKILCDRCTVYCGVPYLPDKILPPKKNPERKEFSHMNQEYGKITNEKSFEFVLRELRKIEDEIAQMSSALEKTCSFLDNLQDFKAKNNLRIENNKEIQKSFSVSDLGDIGEIDEENLKIFESTSPDNATGALKEDFHEQ